MRSNLLTAVFLAGTFCAMGCSTTPPSLSGKVTYKGTPVPAGSIVLHSKEGAKTYTGSIQPDGTFTITGAPHGTMVVTVDNKWLKSGAQQEGTQGVDPKMLEKMMPKDQGLKYLPIPEKYADPKTSPLVWEITTSRESKDFDLND
jgi:hypothetical protein